MEDESDSDDELGVGNATNVAADQVTKSKSRGAYVGQFKVSSHGRLQNKAGRKYWPANRSVYSTATFGKDVKISVHLLVQTLFNDPDLVEWKQGDTVDHMNRNTHDNHRSNLRWASRQLQAENRSKPTPAVNKCCVVEVRCLETGSVTRCSSHREACAMFNLDPGAVARCCSGEYSQTNGYAVKKAGVYETLEGECWAPAEFTGCRVSSFGRVTTFDGQEPYYPSLRNDGYAMFRQHRFPQFVLLAFGFQKPGPDYTVDHIDRDPSNNHLSNLRWASKKLQSNNRKAAAPHCSNFKWQGRRVDQGDWIVYNNLVEAAQKTGVNKRSISDCANPSRRQKTTPGTDGNRYEWRKYVDFDQLDLDGEEWKDANVFEWTGDGKYAGLWERARTSQ